MADNDFGFVPHTESKPQNNEFGFVPHGPDQQDTGIWNGIKDAASAVVSPIVNAHNYLDNLGKESQINADKSMLENLKKQPDYTPEKGKEFLDRYHKYENLALGAAGATGGLKSVEGNPNVLSSIPQESSVTGDILNNTQIKKPSFLENYQNSDTIKPTDNSLFGFDKINNKLSQVPSKLNEIAEHKTYDTLNVPLRAAKMDIKSGDADSIARTLLDKGVAGGWLKTPRGQYEAIQKLKQATGKPYDSLVDLMDQYLKAKNIPAANLSEIAEQAGPNLMENSHLPDVQARNSQYVDKLNNFENPGITNNDVMGPQGNSKDLTFREAETLKRQAQNEVNYNKAQENPDLVKENFNREIGSATRQGLENKVGQYGPEAGVDPADFNLKKQDYGNASAAEEYALGNYAKARKHKINPITSFGHYASTYGNQAMATAANQGSKLAPWVGEQSAGMSGLNNLLQSYRSAKAAFIDEPMSDDDKQNMFIKGN